MFFLLYRAELTEGASEADVREMKGLTPTVNLMFIHNFSRIEEAPSLTEWIYQSIQTRGLHPETL